MVYKKNMVIKYNMFSNNTNIDYKKIMNNFKSFLMRALSQKPRRM